MRPTAHPVITAATHVLVPPQYAPPCLSYNQDRTDTRRYTHSLSSHKGDEETGWPRRESGSLSLRFDRRGSNRNLTKCHDATPDLGHRTREVDAKTHDQRPGKVRSDAPCLWYVKPLVERPSPLDRAGCTFTRTEAAFVDSRHCLPVICCRPRESGWEMSASPCHERQPGLRRNNRHQRHPQGATTLASRHPPPLYGHGYSAALNDRQSRLRRSGRFLSC